ncbi:MAG: hypothetical protein SchgKO_07320 [Schleiferiaceae bacterium]
MKKHYFPLVTSVVLSLCFSSAAIAQQSVPVKLQSGTYHIEASSTTELPDLTVSEKLSNSSLYLATFTQIPTTAELNQLKSSGWDVIGYYPEKTYLINRNSNNSSIPTINSLNAVTPFEGNMKLSKRVLNQEFPSYALNGSNGIKLVLKTVNSKSLNYQLRQLQNLNVEVTGYRTDLKTIDINASWDDVEALAALPFVHFIQAAEDPGETENYTARTSHRSNYINTDADNGLHFDGEGVVVGLGDDGPIGPHIDYSGRLIGDKSTTNQGDHGDHVAGTIFGAGNVDPEGRGMAPGADMVYYDYPDNIFDSPADHSTFGVRITSSSYSNGCNAGYTTFTEFIDNSSYQEQSLLHVFSAGNSNNQNCGYGAGTQWGNVTGGHKIGKNAIAVANLTNQDIIASSSSRGPSADGRIKPDISATGTSVYSTIDPNTYGFKTGTSMSCPGVSGTIAQLYHAYRTTHSGNDPNAGLMKSIVLNTAEDLGNAGPDFIFGYGRINARRAYEVIEGDYFMLDSISNGQTDTAYITVPANTANLRVMVYWTDPSATAGAGKVLVNDLDMQVISPSNTSYQPWVLDPTPNATTLDLPAVRATDSLNNAEQVTLTNPAAGTYAVVVNGTSIPFGSHGYYITYYFENEKPQLTYPIGGEGFANLTQETIKWDAPKNHSDNFQIQYTVDNGANWSNVVASLVPQTRQHTWTVPAGAASSQARVRIISGSDTTMSPEPFSIVGTPTNLVFTKACPDSVIIEWDNVSNAVGYEVMVLGNKYMDSVGTTTQTKFAITGFNPNNPMWATVRAIAPGGGKGQRAYAIEKPAGTFNCALPNDLAFEYFASPFEGEIPTCLFPSPAPVKIRVTNNGTAAITTFDAGYIFNGSPAVTETFNVSIAPGASQTVTFSSSVPGSPGFTRTIEGWVTAPGDLNIYNDSAEASFTLYNSVTAPANYVENFDNMPTCDDAIGCGIDCILMNGMHNYSNGTFDDADFRVHSGFTASNSTGPGGDHTTGNGNYVYIEASGDCFNSVALMHTPCITVVPGPFYLKYAYHMFGTDMGELHIDLITADGIVEDAHPPVVGNQGNTWFEDSVDLSAYTGQEVVVRFRGETGPNFRSDIAIDDIQITPKNVSLSESAVAAKLKVYPNPSEGVFRIENAEGITIDHVEITDIAGKLLFSSDFNNDEVTIDVNYLPTGTYFLTVNTAEGNGTHKIRVE